VKYLRHLYRAKHGVSHLRQRLLIVSATAVVAATAAGILQHEMGHPALSQSAPDLTTVDMVRAGDQAASRADSRTPKSAEAPAPSASASAAPSASPTPTGPPAPVAGLDQAEMANATAIVQAGKQRGLPQRALVIAVATALQESNLYNTASTAIPDSFNYPHQGTSSDYDSVGLFQQRTSQGWGTVQQLMDPVHSAGLFYDRLVQVAGWDSMPLSAAAQSVQRSAFPDAYAKHEARATQIVAALG
jgi:hypothetical protein